MRSLVWLVLASTGLAFGQSDDIKRGNHLDALLLDSHQVVEDPVLRERITEVCQALVKASGNPHGFEYRVTVLNTTDPTAFSAPGGHIYISSGLLRRLDSKDELAAALAHEIAHVDSRHGMKTGMGPKKRKLISIALAVGSQQLGQWAGSVVSDALAPHTGIIYPTPGGGAFVDDRAGSMAGWLVSSLTQVAINQTGGALLDHFRYGYKEKFEFEADADAVAILAKAGYRASALVTLLKRLADLEDSPGEVPFFTLLHSSHDRLHARVAAVEKASLAPNQGSNQ